MRKIKKLVVYNPELLDPLTEHEKTIYKTLGNFIFYFIHIFKMIQGFPWYLIGQWLFFDVINVWPYEIENQYNIDGSINMSFCKFIIFWYFGCFLNALFGCSYVIYTNASENTITDNNQFSLAVGFIVWWTTMFCLVLVLYRKSIGFGERAEKEDAIIDAQFFRVLGLRSAIQVDRSLSAPIWLLVSFIPALIVGFNINYFHSRQFVIACDYNQKVGDFCNDDACCNIEEHQLYDFYTFFAFFSANIMGAYKLLEMSAVYIFYSNLAWEESNSREIILRSQLESIGEKCCEIKNNNLMGGEDVSAI